MNELAFADAAATRPVVVLRTRLEPFSIGHEILLHSQRNPLAVLDSNKFSELSKTSQRLAVIKAVMICCRGWEANKKPHKWMWLWMGWISRENFDVAIEDFRKYRFYGSSFPTFRLQGHFKDDGAGRPFGGSFLCRLLHFLKDDFDYPLGLAQWKYFCIGENDGSCHIENDYERQVREEIKFHEDAVRKEKEGLCPS